MRIRIWFLVCIFFAAALARAEDFEIERFDVNLQLTKISVLEVTENLDVYFTAPRHGIIRRIPYRYTVSWQNNRYTTLLYDVAVGGGPASVSRHGDYYDIKIGSSDRLVSGMQHYQIRYKVYGAIRFFSGRSGDYSELYWNLTGNDWDVPINQVVFHVQTPAYVLLSSSDYSIYTGARDSRLSNAYLHWDGTQLSGRSSRGLDPKEGVTVAMRFPAGYLQDGDTRLRMQFILENYGILLVPLVAFVILFGTWYTVGRDEHGPEMVYYSPPEGLTCAEAGVLIDDRVDNVDLTSLIIYWATKNILQIEQVGEGSHLLSSRDYSIKRLADLPADARSYERIIFDRLFLEGPVVTLSSLRQKFSTALIAARSELSKSIDRLGLYDSGTRGMGAFLTFSGLVIGIAGSAIFFKLGQLNGVFSMALTGIIFAVFGRIMPKKSPSGFRLYQQLRGFREFIERADRMRLETFLRQDPNYFDKTIPYAVVFGMAAIWAKRFDGLLAQAPSWFVGYGTATSLAHFGRSLEDSSAAMNSTLSAAPPGQSGSSFGGAGGSSGGGFGGGGGSSW